MLKKTDSPNKSRLSKYPDNVTLDDLYRMQAEFEDADDGHALAIIQNCIEDRLCGVECPRPEAALIASLLLLPESLAEVRRLLPTERAFQDSQLRNLYKALLVTPYAGLATWWQDIAATSGENVLTVTGIAIYEFSNAYHAQTYARLVFAAAAQREMMKCAETLAQGAGGASPLQAVDTSLRKLQALKSRIDGAADLLC